MRLKLSGPDYKNQDPVTALADFKKRVSLYEKKYVPLGDFEERNNMQYIQVNLDQMISRSIQRTLLLTPAADDRCGT